MCPPLPQLRTIRRTPEDGSGEGNLGVFLTPPGGFKGVKQCPDCAKDAYRVYYGIRQSEHQGQTDEDKEYADRSDNRWNTGSNPRSGSIHLPGRCFSSSASLASRFPDGEWWQ